MRVRLMLAILLLCVPRIAGAQSTALPERIEIIASQFHDFDMREAARTRIELKRTRDGYAWHVPAHSGHDPLMEREGHIAEAAVRRLVDVMRTSLPAIPDPDEYGTPAQMQSAIDAAFDPGKWAQADAYAAARGYRERLRDQAAVGRVIGQVRGNFANHLHRSLKVDLHFADGSVRTASSREMGLRMAPWQHPDGGISHSLAFADAVAALLPEGAMLREVLTQPINDDARAAMMGFALRDANAYHDAFNRAPAAAQRLRRHFTVLRMSFTDRPESGDFAAFQAYLKTGRWPSRPSRLHVQLTDLAARRNIVLFAELLLADADLAKPSLIQAMQERLARVAADARLSKLAPRDRITTEAADEMEPEVRKQFARQMAKAGWPEFQRAPASLDHAVLVNIGSERWMLLRDGRSVLWKRDAIGKLPQAGERWCAGIPHKWQRERPEPPDGQKLSRGNDLVCVARMHSVEGEVIDALR